MCYYSKKKPAQVFAIASRRGPIVTRVFKAVRTFRYIVLSLAISLALGLVLTLLPDLFLCLPEPRFRRDIARCSASRGTSPA